MGKHSSHSEHADAARQLLKEAKTAYEIRLAQSLLLPLELGLTLEQTARAIGRCAGATSVMRSSFEKKVARLAAARRQDAMVPYLAAIDPPTEAGDGFLPSTAAPWSRSPAPLHSRNHDQPSLEPAASSSAHAV